MPKKPRSAIFLPLLLVFIGQMSQSAGSQPDNAQGWVKANMLFNKAVEAFQMGDYGVAVQLLQIAEPLAAGRKEFYNLQALCYSELGNNSLADARFRQALSLDYNYVPCRNNYGVFLLKIGSIDDAQRAFEECIRIDSHYPDAYYHLASIMQKKGDLDKAIDLYDTACRLKPDYVDAERDLGLAIYERVIAGQGGTLEDAVSRLRIAAHYAPNNPLVHYHLGRILCAQGGLDDAETAFRTALMKDPQLAAAHWELAKLRYLRGDPYRAIDEADEVDKISPVYTEGKHYPKVDPILVNTLAAKSFEIIGYWQSADGAWRKVANLETNNLSTVKHINDLRHELKDESKPKKGQVDPKEIHTLIWKGVRQVDDGDVSGAKSNFERALELDARSFGAIENLGEIMEAGGDLNGALAKYQAAMALKPKYDGLYYNMAYLLEKMNLPADAGLMYQKFHELAGRYPYDPKHIVSLQQDEARQRALEELKHRRGY
jgi:tetratricopeptide (TPR) repeat protein